MSLLVFVHGASAQGWKLSDKLTLKADLTMKETYDDNVFILNTYPYAGITSPSRANIRVPELGSFVTSITPNLLLNYKPSDEFNATVSYAPEFTWYASAHSEDYVAQRAAINFNGTVDAVTYECLNSAVWIDGSDLSPLTLRPADVAAVGGIALRDRRDAAVFRDSIKVTIPSGKWFVRPVATSYIHNFKTEQMANLNSSYFYNNYIDRWEVNGGLDVGYEVAAKTHMVAGYRFGHQDQSTAPNGVGTRVESPYNNNYQRFLVGLEGSPAPWVKFAVLGGPDVRDWLRETPDGFDRNQVLWYMDAMVTLLPTREDTITFKMTNFNQPAFTSHSIYQDLKYDLVWRHKFSEKFTAGAGMTLYIGKWMEPVLRNDWIYTPSLMASYAFSPNLIAEASWSYDSAQNHETQVAGTQTQYADGREYQRNLLALSLKYTF